MNGSTPRWRKALPLLGTLAKHKRADFASDLVAGAVTAILLVPQGIAFAMLAGLPPQVGLYASILPPLTYALLGTSRTLSVGPVSVAAIMVASALAQPPPGAQQDYLGNALILAFEGGVFLLGLASLRLGALVNFVSHAVLAGFTSGAAILIILSQLPHLIGAAPAASHTGIASLRALPSYFSGMNNVTLAVGLASALVLYAFNRPLARWLQTSGLPSTLRTPLGRVGPLVVVAGGALAAGAWALAERHHVAVVGVVPSGLPRPSLHFFSLDSWWRLAPSACLIALVGYVESVAMAKVLASRRRQRIDANQELIALGCANLAAAMSGTMPVAGGFSRTMVNFAAGAQSQLASIVTACLVALALMFFAPAFHDIPKATLAAIIIVAIVPLVAVKSFAATWRYDPGDGAAMLATFAGVLLLGIEQGLSAGIVLSLLIHLWRTSRPHIAVVGRIAGSEHFRNVKRHQVETWQRLLIMRVDENLTFTNIGFVESAVVQELAAHPAAEHVVLIASAVNHVDSSALEGLESLISALRASGVTLHLAEVKGPVMDHLEQIEFTSKLEPGKVFLSANEAVLALTEPAPKTDVTAKAERPDAAFDRLLDYQI